MAPDPATAVILLAAGRSTRFGSDKLVSNFDGRPLWEWAASAAEQAGFAHRFLVFGDHSSIPERVGWETVLNPRAAEGMGTSIASGVAEAARRQVRRIVVCLADMPRVPASHLQKLADCKGTVFTRYDETTLGVPAGFDRELFDALQALRGEQGARSLVSGHARSIAMSDRDFLVDIDTCADMAP